MTTCLYEAEFSFISVTKSETLVNEHGARIEGRVPGFDKFKFHKKVSVIA
jgi:hypothetical protein